MSDKTPTSAPQQAGPSAETVHGAVRFLKQLRQQVAALEKSVLDTIGLPSMFTQRLVLDLASARHFAGEELGLIRKHFPQFVTEEAPYANGNNPESPLVDPPATDTAPETTDAPGGFPEAYHAHSGFMDSFMNDIWDPQGLLAQSVEAPPGYRFALVGDYRSADVSRFLAFTGTTEDPSVREWQPVTVLDPEYTYAVRMDVADVPLPEVVDTTPPELPVAEAGTALPEVGSQWRFRGMDPTGPADSAQRPNVFTVVDAGLNGVRVRQDGDDLAAAPQRLSVAQFQAEFEPLTAATVGT